MKCLQRKLITNTIRKTTTKTYVGLKKPKSCSSNHASNGFSLNELKISAAESKNDLCDMIAKNEEKKT